MYDFELLLCSVIRSFTVAVDDGCFILQNVQECARVKSKNRKKTKVRANVEFRVCLRATFVEILDLRLRFASVLIVITCIE